MRRKEYFEFKQFTVHQEHAAMKVGTDGAILGAWVPLPTEENPQILDIGCGTGVISIMKKNPRHRYRHRTSLPNDGSAMP